MSAVPAVPAVPAAPTVPHWVRPAQRPVPAGPARAAGAWRYTAVLAWTTCAAHQPPACPPSFLFAAGSYFHYSVPDGFTAPQAKDITPPKKLLGGGGDPM